MAHRFGGKLGQDWATMSASGRAILEYYGFDGYSNLSALKGELIGYLLLFALAFFLMTWAALQFKRLTKQ
jgi:hypothetical protein